MENKIYEVYEIFYFYLDIATETQIEKVIVNEQDIFDFYDGASDYKKIISFYGDADEMTKYFQKLLNTKLSLKNNNYPATFFGIFTDKTIYLILSCNSSFFHEKPLKKESLLITMKKYLQDITNNIIILPDKFTLDNWNNETQTPFDEEHSVIRKIEIVEKKEERLEIEDFEIEHKNVDDILVNQTEIVKFDNNFSSNFWVYKVYNNSENQEKSSVIFFNHIKQELLKYLKLKESQVLETVNKLGLNFANSSLLSSMHSFRVNFFKKFLNDLEDICKAGFFNMRKFDYLELQEKHIVEKLEEKLSLLLKSKFQNFFKFDMYFSRLPINNEEYENFLHNYYNKVSELIDDTRKKDEFYKKLISKIKIKDYNNLIQAEISIFEKTLMKNEMGSLDKFHMEFIKSISFKDCLEINRISINITRNDTTGKTSLNLLQLPNKFKFEEMLLLEKITKKKQDIAFFTKFKILNIFPTINPNNIIFAFVIPKI